MPLNENDILNIEKTLNYTFKNKVLLIQSFTTRSYGAKHNVNNNEVLEFFGDRVLEYIVTRLLMNNYIRVRKSYEYDNDKDEKYIISKYINEGDLTIKKNSLVCNKYLAQRLEKMELDKYILISGKSLKKMKKETAMKHRADLYEAILGAIAIDCSYNEDILSEYVIKTLSLDSQNTFELNNICIDKNKYDTDPFDYLLELARNGYLSIPEVINGSSFYDFNGTHLIDVSICVKSLDVTHTVLATGIKTAKKIASQLILDEFFNAEYKAQE